MLLRTSTTEQTASPKSGRRSSSTAAPPVNDASPVQMRTSAPKLEQYETSYGEYLNHARECIYERARASRSWVFDYDGDSPPADVFDRMMVGKSRPAPPSEVQNTLL